MGNDVVVLRPRTPAISLQGTQPQAAGRPTHSFICSSQPVPGRIACRRLRRYIEATPSCQNIDLVNDTAISGEGGKGQEKGRDLNISFHACIILSRFYQTIEHSA